MMSSENDAEKTESPTPYRREKARQEGQIPRSRELTSVLMLLTGWSLMWTTGAQVAHQLARLLQHGLMFDNLLLQDAGSMIRQLSTQFSAAAASLLPFLFGLFLVGLTAPMLLGGFYLSSKALKCDLSRLSPLAGFKRIYSAQLLTELLKSVLKVIFAGTSCALYLHAHRASVMQLPTVASGMAIREACTLILHCTLLAALAVIPMAAYDILSQLHSHNKKLRMTRQEIRDEFKEQEGNPQLKGRIRQMQRAMARGRMMADVPDADVIVNNPTHYAVALRYREGDMAAPVLLAKGAGAVALRIREEAAKHNIPMLEAPPLARALYRHGEIGDPIPAALYSAVAEVLAWVYSLERWRKAGGLQPKKPENLPVPAALDFKHESEIDG